MARDKAIITMVGASRYNTATYRFSDGSLSSKTTIFSKALIEHYRDELRTVVFLGTETSSWSAILPEPESEEDRMLIERLKDSEAIKPNRPPISKEDFESVKKRLKEYYSDFSVHVLPPQKSNISLEDNPLDVYAKIINYVKDSKIIFDITSAFRYMPLFIFESLQTYSPDFNINDITLLYAEQNEDGKDSQVRDISEVWRAAEINKALYTFQMTFKGDKLSTYIKETGEEGFAKWVFQFSDNVQKSYLALCDERFFKRLKDIIALKEIEQIQPPFVKESFVFLRDKVLPRFDYIENVTEGNRRSCYLFTFAEILNEKKLYAQAFISLRESVVMRIIENKEPQLLNKRNISPEDLDNIDLYKYLDDLLESYDKDVQEAWKVFKWTRNRSAHAGIELINNRKYMHQSDDFEKYHKAVKEILENIIKCKEKDASGS